MAPIICGRVLMSTPAGCKVVTQLRPRDACQSGRVAEYRRPLVHAILVPFKIVRVVTLGLESGSRNLNTALIFVKFIEESHFVVLFHHFESPSLLTLNDRRLMSRRWNESLEVNNNRWDCNPSSCSQLISLVSSFEIFSVSPRLRIVFSSLTHVCDVLYLVRRCL